MIYLIAVLIMLASPAMAGTEEPLSSEEEVMYDFRNSDATTLDQLPNTSGGWSYKSASYAQDVSGNPAWNHDSWLSTSAQSSGLYYVVHNYYDPAHDDSWSYGYSDLQSCPLGVCLTANIMGGYTAGGTDVRNKEDWLSSAKIEGTGLEVGGYWYFQSQNSTFGTGINTLTVPFDAAVPATGSYNRMSYYYKGNPGAVNTVIGSRPSYNGGVFPFIHADAVGGHYYHFLYLNGGGWWKMQADTHPDHRNFDNTGEASSFLSNKPTYFDTMKAFYIQDNTEPGGITGQVPFKTFLGPVVMWKDPEPQNEETITTLASVWNPTERYFEISFLNKYLNVNAWGLFELRYSSSPITNANWSSATPASIQAYAPWHIDARTDGIFIKPFPGGYKQCWVRFKLQTADNDALDIGDTVYFAVKDISQNETNKQLPKTGADCLGTYYSTCGRDYTSTTTYGWDWAHDEAAIELIKRTSYTIYAMPGDETPDPTNGSCGTADGVTVSSPPTTNLCTAGTAGTVTLSGSNYIWDCTGSNGGTTDNCSAPYEAEEPPPTASGHPWSVSGAIYVNSSGQHFAAPAAE